MLPQNYVQVDDESAPRVLRLMDALEEHDDVQNVWANFDIDADVLAARESS
jgi:transcriptional/translational regulatory protein YebC/TACO1